jgi:hypothetical protein
MNSFSLKKELPRTAGVEFHSSEVGIFGGDDLTYQPVDVAGHAHDSLSGVTTHFNAPLGRST